ncbi:MAG: DUF4266 domain-containing protein [Polyangiaceae bacterium]|nr:DUF4266 domain-containing protein [Polyangiaceae bacterium]NUQ72257.1 DUF4266 domain-containing protein [Polyangiaceae bacterium]
MKSTLSSRFLGALGLVALAGGAASCAPVKPWERGRLSSPSMQNKLGEAGSKGIYRAKVLETRTGGGLPGEAPGGGCGCTH